jgi:hypothetical protein
MIHVLPHAKNVAGCYPIKMASLRDAEPSLESFCPMRSAIAMPIAPRTHRSSLCYRAARRLAGCAVLTLLLLNAFPYAEAAPLNKEEQMLVDHAIDAGAAYLKRSQGSNGTWAGPKEKHQLGYAVLPGLTLLECGVPAKEQVVRRVAVQVRRAAANLTATYELSLCILFLDRLGDPKDHDLIQTLAVRLIAGQMETGGWTYNCPLVNHKTRDEMLALLRKLDPPEPMEAVAKAGREPLADTPARPKPATPPLEGTTTGKPSSTPQLGGGVPELPDPPMKKKPIAADKPAKADKPNAPVVIPRHLKNLTVFRTNVEPPQRSGKKRGKWEERVSTDNSNTQFAILALWAAQRYDVPARRTMQLMIRRFENSQNLDGSWGYRFPHSEGEAAMTCVGLLGLAVGHGIAHQPNGGDGKTVVDPRILKGFSALSQSVGRPTGTWRNLPMENTYYLWSLERVGVLYGLPTVGGREWYRWGAEILIANQQPRGFWNSTHYPGSSPTIDTCMALLFLKRANFVADLSKKLNIKPEDLNETIIRSSPSRSPGESLNPEKR